MKTASKRAVTWLALFFFCLAAPGAAEAHDKSAGDLLRSFEGLSEKDVTAPSSALAVGPGHVLQASDNGFVVFDKSGFRASCFTPFEQVFRGVLEDQRPLITLSEPQAVYSREHQRYVMLVAGVDRTFRRSYFFLAISATSSPLGEWWPYRFSNEYPGDDAWLGDPALGVDTWGVYMTGNLYTWAADAFKNAVVWSLDPAILRGGPARAHVASNLEWPDRSPVFGLRPALPHTVSTEQATFFVATRRERGDQIGLWRLTGERGVSPELESEAIATAPYQAIGRRVEQPQTLIRIDGGDARVRSAVYAHRRVYAAWTTDPGADGASSAVQWVKLDTDARGVVTEEIVHGGDGWYYFHPAITVRGGSGPLLDTGLVFNAIERNARDGVYLSAAAYLRDTEGDVHFRVVALGEGLYTGPLASANAMAYDWSRPGWMWGSVQYARDDYSWGTRIAALAMDREARDDVDSLDADVVCDGPVVTGPTVCTPDDTTVCLADGRFQVEIAWRDFDGGDGDGEVAPAGTDNSALFWFFDPDNWEMLVKVLDGCGVNDRYWVFAAATTDVAYTLKVTDTEDGSVVEYSNPLGNAAAAITDTEAFDGCP